MLSKNVFKYRKGHTQIESAGDNKAAIKLAYLNTIFYWLLRLLMATLALHKVLYG
jgi:hypothetical protein